MGVQRLCYTPKGEVFTQISPLPNLTFAFLFVRRNAVPGLSQVGTAFRRTSTPELRSENISSRNSVPAYKL
jgi:hypothetical protein